MTPERGTIHILSQSVVEKIAAGEVVERPASVLKELVENCIDAGATRIDIATEEAGFSLIRVSDNGSGIAPEDLPRSVLRHATSKITSADDLFRIGTMGFRGEALASIAAVSRLRVSSSTATDGLGFAISCEGGGVGEVEPQRHTRGTTISCRDLFFNVPARKKFMKSHKAERMALARTVEQLVIPFPSIHFTFTSEGKKILETPVAAGVRERLAQVAGHEFARGLIECTAERENQAATILISPPEQASARPRFQYLYVNLRRVDNDSITYGIRESFSRFMMSQYRPAWFCFLDIDPTSVDVNIHPTKQRVKFDDDRKLFGFVHKAVRNGIDQWMVSRDDAMSDRSASGSSENRHVEGPRVRESQPDMLGARSTPAPGDTEPRSEEAPVDDQGVQTSLSFLSIASQTHKGIDRQSDESVQLQEEQWDLIPCYQIHKLYILAPIKKGILLIDQHAAHERILYEQALVEFRQEGRAASQRLLFPIVLELAQTEKSVVIAGRDFYSALGFDIQDWGGRAVAISAIPATGFLRESGIEKALHEMVRFLMDDKTSEFFTAPEKRFAAAYACGAAIKAGQVLKQEEMNSLLNNLFAVENPYVCPHGRPTMVRISLDELGRRFLR